MRTRLDVALSTLVTFAAVAVAGAVVRREFLPTSVGARPAQPSGPTHVEGWQDLMAGGVRSGSVSAPVTIVEFGDLECPFCGEFHKTLRTMQQRYGEQLSYVFVHYPIPRHRFARPAARAAECAHEQGLFFAFVDQVLKKQDSLGLKSWASYAREAGVKDTARFARCASDTVAVSRIDTGVALGKRIGIVGTPTILVNGWRLASTPTDSEMTVLLANVLAKRDSIRAKPGAPPRE